MLFNIKTEKYLSTVNTEMNFHYSDQFLLKKNLVCMWFFKKVDIWSRTFKNPLVKLEKF